MTSTPVPSEEPTLRVDSTLIASAGDPFGQLAPGTVIADRYRISSLLGSGGMGDVYRADDLRLGQAVALKFLPPALARNRTLHEQLHDEVRLGRQVTHPNVCRIYDIGDWNGSYFVAMEHVDGEDLARLLRRIGRIPHDKAVEIARGIAAGLAAAHAKGILHRDLKPANIMIDSHGEARIMDFGLALTHDLAESGGAAGTPAYMAPEQLLGSPASIRSDIYALGLVLYELFTGRRLHTGKDISQLRLQHEQEISPPSNYVPELDPKVERLILRCLSRDPEQRPRSVREVFEALPGGDVLAAAMAAGETPSPRVVAAAGSEGLMSPRKAWALVVLAAALLALRIGVESRVDLLQFVPMEKPPAVLEERNVEIATALGSSRQPYRWSALQPEKSYLASIATHDRSFQRWERLRRGPAAVTFWTRQSPAPLTPLSTAPAATRTDPPLATPGMTLTESDTKGRLVRFEAAADPKRPAVALDWRRLFDAAGFDIAKFRAAAPHDAPPLFADARTAWDGNHPDDGTPIHVESAAAHGAPVYFRVSGAWSNDSRASEGLLFSGPGFVVFVYVAIALIAIVAITLAARNLRLRRGDRKGALRLSGAIFLLEILNYLLVADHELGVSHEVSRLRSGLSIALFWGAALYVLYIALEPFVRRRWPDKLISWSRLLAGHWRDPMVGRDILIGTAAGLGHATLATLMGWLPGVLHRQPGSINLVALDMLIRTRFAVAYVPDALESGVIDGLAIMILLVALSIVLRRRALAIGGLAALFITGFTIALHGNVNLLPFGILITALIVYIVARYGLLAVAALQVAFQLTFFYPLTFTGPSWTIGAVMVPILAVAAIVIWSFRTAVGDQPLFSGAAFAED